MLGHQIRDFFFNGSKQELLFLHYHPVIQVVFQWECQDSGQEDSVHVSIRDSGGLSCSIHIQKSWEAPPTLEKWVHGRG